MQVRLQDIVEPLAQECLEDSSFLRLSISLPTMSDSSCYDCRLVSRLGHVPLQTCAFRGRAAFLSQESEKKLSDGSIRVVSQFFLISNQLLQRGMGLFVDQAHLPRGDINSPNYTAATQCHRTSTTILVQSEESNGVFPRIHKYKPKFSHNLGASQGLPKHADSSSRSPRTSGL